MVDAVKDAQERFADALEVLHDQRKQIQEDLKFSDPTKPDQWDEQERIQRESDPGGARPCLVMDQTGQYISNVAGQVEQRPPSMNAIPSSDGADKRVAEQLDGHFRHIEHASRAQQHYARALTSAARAGVGYLIVRPDYTDRALGYQEPRISSEGDPLRVVLDPWSVELDGSDAGRGWLLTPMSHHEFERQFGARTDKASFGADALQAEDDERDSVVVAEEWRKETETVNMIFAVDLDSDKPDDVFAIAEKEYWEKKKEGRQLKDTPDSAGRRTYTDKTTVVKWSRMSGADVLTPEREYPADGIGIVPVYGYVGWEGGRMKYCGIARRARGPAQAYNFHVSEIRAIQSQAAKSPWLVPINALAGDENLKKLWDRANVEQRAFLPYNDWDSEGARAVAPPSRIQPSVNLANHIQGAAQAKEDIQASLGMYYASLGAPSNETSGVAIDSRKQQGEASTAHFPSHLAASLGQVGKLCMQMIPRLVDTKRQLRMLSIDKTPSSMTIDPKQQGALLETPKGLSVNPNVGKYDVRVVIGPTFSTQRQESREELREMMRANPALTPAIAPLWASTLDVPHADKLAQVLTAMAPDSVKAILQPDEQDETVGELKAKLEQTQQALQEAIQHAHAAQQDADEANSQLQDKSDAAEAKSDETAIKAYDSYTKRIQVLGATITPQSVQQIAQQAIAEAMAQPKPTDEPKDASGDLLQQPGVESPGVATEPAQMPQEPAAPAGPSPDIVHLMEAIHAQAASLMRLADALATPKKRIAVRDKAGNILHTIEQPHTEQLAQPADQPQPAPQEMPQ